MTRAEFTARLSLLFGQNLPRMAGPSDFLQAMTKMWPHLAGAVAAVDPGDACVIVPTSDQPDHYLVTGFRPVPALIEQLVTIYGEDRARSALTLLRTPCPEWQLQIVVCVPSVIAAMRIALPPLRAGGAR